MSAAWTGTARDWPEEEQTRYRESLGLPPTPRYELQREGEEFDAADRKWKEPA